MSALLNLPVETIFLAAVTTLVLREIILCAIPSRLTVR